MTNNGGCAHMCVLSHLDVASLENGFRCKCKIGFRLNRDLKGCTRFIDSLYVSQKNMIRGISMEQADESESRMPLLLPRLSATRALEVDCINNRTFFHDPIRKAIFVQ